MWAHHMFQSTSFIRKRNGAVASWITPYYFISPLLYITGTMLNVLMFLGLRIYMDRWPAKANCFSSVFHFTSPHKLQCVLIIIYREQPAICFSQNDPLNEQ